jgi:hypothetical protein
MSRNRISKDAFSQMVTISLLTAPRSATAYSHRRDYRGAIESPRCLVESG